ncbi:MAG: FxDxF family PEP-CTERM protein [Burkholderiaceae bacterium]
MKLKSGAKKLAVVAALVGASFAANATITNLGLVTTGVPLSFAGLAGNGGFDDVFTFTLPANGGSGYSAANFTLLPSALYHTVLSTMSLLTDPDGSVSGTGLFNGDEAPKGSSVSFDSGATLALTAPASGGGKMVLHITGITTGTSGGIYTGAISAAAVTPVPEPESYAMLLAGLGVMGAIAIRRNKKKSD